VNGLILSCGEALIDFIPVDLAAGGHGYRPCPGGSPYNVARALGRLGVPTGFLSAISRDFFGDQLVEGLRESKVLTEFVQRLDRPSTLGFVSLDRAEASYAFYDAAAANRSWSGTPGAAQLEPVAALHFGSISLLREPAASAYEALFLREAGGRRAVSFDPNIRRDLITDEAAYRARLGRLLASADIVKVSSQDLDWMMPGVAPDAVAASCFTGRAALVVITHGAEGVTGWTRRSRVEEPCVPTEVVDTVGAGDSFMAGLLANLHGAGVLSPTDLPQLSEAALRNALVAGQHVASMTFRRQGADAPWRDQLPPELFRKPA